MPNETRLKQFGEIITTLQQGKNLTRKQSASAWKEVIENTQPELHQGAFLAALSMKGETESEIAGSYDAIYQSDTQKVDLSHLDAVENCGTGMDTLKTFNISTAASIVAAAAGVPMAKHGARAITSQCGTVDVLEQLGVDVECDVQTVQRSIESVGIGIFNGMSANVHPEALFRILSQIRFGSTLNIAGSLASPASPRLGVRGVWSPKMVRKTAATMATIGYRRALVVFGWNDSRDAGIDEFSTMGPSLVAEVHEDGAIDEYEITPEEFGIPRVAYSEIAAAGNVVAAARIVRSVLDGNGTSAQRDIVCLNAAPVLLVAQKVETLKEGIDLARRTINDGLAAQKLNDWVANQQRVCKTA
ncbi:MAG: anthranilate phosphoribosyltransferase [Deltaproteobacteria bacterium]|nr:anthranilate phosphoribosyltransferase [Deltaproteobacteria bacterium]